MHCIPVLDLLGGQVVRAVRGERAAYRPLVSCLAKSSAPLAVAAALRTQFDSRAFYLADLDAILGSGDNRTAILALIAAHPDCDWWLDAGFSTVDALARWQGTPTVRCVLGSESLESLEHYLDLRAVGVDVLSLDRRGETLLGPAALWAGPAHWPSTLIAMNLAQVGAGLGPDFGYLDSLRAQAPTARLVAAGGVRHVEDLLALDARGISAVLLASALHDGALVAADLARVAAPVEAQGPRTAITR